MKTLLKDLTWKFSFLACLLIIAVTLASNALLMKQARVAMESRLSEKAVFINTFYAFLIADALQRKDDVTLQQVVNRLEEDPEITSVLVVDDKGEVRYHVDADKLGTIFDDPVLKKALETGDGVMTPFTNSGGRALALVSPLKVQGKPHPMGAVRIELTYRHVLDILGKFGSSFRLSVLGFLTTGVGLMIIFMRKWIGAPLESATQAVSGMHLATAEANLPESSDEFGRLNKALNDMVLRFRAEVQEQLGTGPVNPAENEKELIGQLVQAFLSQSSVILADKENKIIYASNTNLPVTTEPAHLLDLITDVNFANLVAAAFQKEGEGTSGPIQFHDKPYMAAVLCIPGHQSKTVKTVIALQAQPEKGESVS